MELLIDTNVLLDLILKRKNYEQASLLFKKTRELNMRTYISASSVTDLFYIIRRQTHDVDKTYEIMGQIFKLVYVLSVSGEDIETSFGKRWKDFEDCVQYVTAYSNRMNYIISCNTKDFEENDVKVLTIEEFLKEN